MSGESAAPVGAEQQLDGGAGIEHQHLAGVPDLIEHRHSVDVRSRRTGQEAVQNRVHRGAAH
ncbi:MAG: hypothetical protein LH469_01465 [Frankiaceae bacterium]|nr:hypothetical protein [Frankiaceae bacterium]